jgi:hypothetical protein
VGFDSGWTPADRRLDALFEVLASRRRRRALSCLRRHDSPMTLADLADEVAEREAGASLSAVSAEEVLEVYLSLYHSHVPKLVEARMAEYSQERDLVALSLDPEYLELLERIESATGRLFGDEDGGDDRSQTD